MRGRAVVARRAHNPEVLGSNPSPATVIKQSPTDSVLLLTQRTEVANTQHRAGLGGW